MKSHLLERKSPKRKRAFGQDMPVSESDTPVMKKLLGRG
jgi:ribosomal protein L35